jgi:hypothetical protein
MRVREIGEVRVKSARGSGEKWLVRVEFRTPPQLGKELLRRNASWSLKMSHRLQTT